MTANERKRPLEDDRAPSRSPPRKRKRPGALTTAAAKEAIEKRQQERDRASVQGTVQEISNQYYNNREEYVQTRGRTWRKEESKIKGLRGFNNWVKSCIIQKFSPRERATREERGWGEEPVEEQVDNSPLLVLDMGCGKGGDLTKWKLAPQKIGLYVGLDPATQSIAQANSRYLDMSQQERRQNHRHQNHFRQRRNPLFDSRILVKDCFGESIGDLPIVQEVGFDPGVGPGGNAMQSRWRPGGFDVVTMMFCMHYSFETEAKARQMLKNVAGALKKGGRFIGVIPNSDILSSRVEEWHSQHRADNEELPRHADEQDAEDDSTASKELSTSKPSPDQAILGKSMNGEASLSAKLTSPPRETTSPSRPSPISRPKSNPLRSNSEIPNSISAASNQPPEPERKNPSWGNSLYSVRFVTPTFPLLSFPPSSDNSQPPSITFRPPFGHKYFFYMDEAVDVPEYVVPWEAFRALAEDYNLELRWRKPFLEIWDGEMREAPIYGDRSAGGGTREVAERMGILDRGDPQGRLKISQEEREAVEFYHGFCFIKV